MEMNGGQLMAIIIVAMVMFAAILKARIRYAHKYADRSSEGESRALAEAERLREEVKQLKERLHVLEWIAVEKESSPSPVGSQSEKPVSWTTAGRPLARKQHVRSLNQPERAAT